MTTETIALILHHITPSLTSRQPITRAVAQRVLASLSADLTPEEVERASAQIAQEARTLPPRPAPRVAPTPQPAVKTQAERVAAAQAHMDKIGPALWSDWHRRSLTHEGDDTAYIANLARKLPCGECVKHFLANIEANPPVFGAGYFDYTVLMHNLVREAQGKPTMTPEEARPLYADGV